MGRFFLEVVPTMHTGEAPRYKVCKFVPHVMFKDTPELAEKHIKHYLRYFYGNKVYKEYKI